ncbi:3,5-dihydroxyphenylacetyl-CoA synthase DpgA [Amycolatopsis keratiniphila]|uniref:Chalcone synthase n=1 Tax=Amycolatopsis keratiniphila TaxID=129921 RepID=R4TBW8_9PSEU|nr:3,5-dihydroxyphenylacetyl-CoA synthase DpgA [Amycolatopsis keratiniphila]AGM07913.1 chalcone synthase [Amycolatopsis keratiniphila]
MTAEPHAGVRLVGVGTATPSASYTQDEVLALNDIQDPRVRSVFANSAIDRRHLSLNVDAETGRVRSETQGELLAKHRAVGLDLGGAALADCLRGLDAGLADIAHISCVTSTGLLTPGLSARISAEFGLRWDISRLDVVGMGCNAGLNALNTVTAWASANPGELAVLLCVEVCSAAYVVDGTMRTAVVNSLFGDGAAAVAVTTDPAAESRGPEVLGFASCLITEAIEAMRFDWDDDHGKFSFYLDREVPYVVGAHAEKVVAALLDEAGLQRSQIAHWVVHSGGKKVVDSVRVNLGLTRHDVRHTIGVLRDNGNLSSGSFLFSYQRLLDECVVCPDEYGVLMTMGPGSTIETALVRW